MNNTEKLIGINNMADLTNIDKFKIITKSILYLFVVGWIVYFGVDGLFYWFGKCTGIWVVPDVGWNISFGLAILIAYLIYQNNTRRKVLKEIIQQLANRGISILQQLNSYSADDYIESKDAPFAIAFEEYPKEEKSNSRSFSNFSVSKEAEAVIDEIKSTETYKKLTKLKDIILRYLPKKFKSDHPKETYFIIVKMCRDLIRSECRKEKIKYEIGEEFPENDLNFCNLKNNIMNEYYGIRDHDKYSLKEIEDLFRKHKEKEDEEKKTDEIIKRIDHELIKDDDLFAKDAKDDIGYSDKYCTKCDCHITMNEQYHDNKYCHKCYLELHGCKSDLELANMLTSEKT